MKMEVHATLKQMLVAGKFEPYVHYVRFPRFKNLEPDTRIEFNHPITALVGPNGVNKTSILRALYGVPEGKSTGTYWFSTATDSIPGDRATCIHGRLQNGHMVEALKQRSSADKTLDYWEPSRPIKAYGMEDMPDLPEDAPPEKGRSKTRWDPIEKNVLYLEVSDRASAFDRFFNYSGGQGPEKTKRKEIIKRRSKPLQRAIQETLSKLQFFTKERLVKNEDLPSLAVQAVSEILGRRYESIRWVEHRFYPSEGVTAVLKSTDLHYTEAFAGAGEFAVCQIVRDVLGAKPKSLILIDEPETSLHPHAQGKLMAFLAEEAKRHQHQVIVTTHSPNIIRDLPDDAIKVLTMTPAGGEVTLVSQTSSPAIAFFHIGEPISEKMRIFVEDELSKFVVLKALGTDEAVRAKVSVQPFPGGTSALWRLCLHFALLKESEVRVVFDGDAKPSVSTTVRASELADDKLEEHIASLTRGMKLNFSEDGGPGGGNTVQKREHQRRFIDWVAMNVEFLPGLTPEAFILEATGISSDRDAKEHFLELTKQKLGDPEVNASAILTIQREQLSQIQNDHADLKRLRNSIVLSSQVKS